VLAAIRTADILTLLLGGGLVTSILAIAKFRPESDVLIMTKTKDQVLIKDSIIDDLKDERIRLREENAELRERIAAERALRIDAANRQLIAETRVQAMDEEIRRLRAGS